MTNTLSRICVMLGLLLVTSSVLARPNIILVLADDVSPDLYGIYGQTGAAATPNIDALGEQGVVFRTAWATAMCAPTRVELMTGRYANTTGVYRNNVWLDESRKNVYSENVAFAKILHDAGYATAIAGKWHAGTQMPYDEVLAFDEYALWESLNEIKKLPGSPQFDGLMEDDKTTSRYWHPAYVVNGELLDTQPADYGPDIEAKFITGFIERSVAAGKPFLAYWPTVAPHGSRTGAPTTPLYGEPGVLGDAPNAAERAARFRSLNEYIDLKVGEVWARVTELGIADNTVIFFLSDNGTAVTAKTRGVERGSHVVFVAAGAGVAKRGLTDEITDFTDILPTLVDLAEAQESVPEDADFDGTSLVPFLRGDTDTHRDWIYAYIAGSQLFRTRDYMLEVVNPILGMPKGRLYYTGDERFGRGYTLIGEDEQHEAARAYFDGLLQDFPPLTRDHEFFETPQGKEFLVEYEADKERAKHLYSHKDYDFYDQTYAE